MVPLVGLEPTTSSLPMMRNYQLCYSGFFGKFRFFLEMSRTFPYMLLWEPLSVPTALSLFELRSSVAVFRIRAPTHYHTQEITHTNKTKGRISEISCKFCVVIPPIILIGVLCALANSTIVSLWQSFADSFVLLRNIAPNET